MLGVLFEKERTTPDQYPLSLNALMNGCNQKSNREPVLTLSEADVQAAVDSLINKNLLAEVAVGSRVKKYRQRFANTQFSEFKLSLKEQSIISVLFLRGPQTPGELRTRTNRLCEFRDVEEVEQVLQNLMDRSGDAYVKKLPREAGKRESRYIHLFSGVSAPNSFTANITSDTVEPGNTTDESTSYKPRAITLDDSNTLSADERMRALEAQVATMQNEIDDLKRLWADLND